MLVSIDSPHGDQADLMAAVAPTVIPPISSALPIVTGSSRT
jgi:hypothetical protein